jgi:hypothetical protein
MSPGNSRPARAPLRRGIRRMLGILALAALLSALAGAAPGPTPSAQGGLGIGGKFGIFPAPDSLGRATAYFQLTVAPGHSAAATAVISNLADTAETLAIGRATGITATNGGSAYLPQSQGCSGASCWVTGLPSRVTLPAHSRELLKFTVSVPAGAAPRQYLTGISAEPAARPRSVKVGSNGNASAGAVIVEEVTVGVAITAGDLSAMVTRLQVPAVRATLEDQAARLDIQLDNTGQTFTGGAGTASCAAAGKQHVYRVVAGTVLPQGHALIAIGVPGLPAGASVPCTIRISYGKSQTASWTGTVTIPAPPPTRIVRTGKGAYSEFPQGGTPGWAIALIILGALLLAGVAILLYRAYRPR